MSLTGPALPIVLGVVAVVAVVLLGWGRPAPRHPVAAGAVRVLLAFVMCLSVLGLIGALFNNQYAFFTSWGDLLGGSESKTREVKYGASPQEVVRAQPTPTQRAAVATAVEKVSARDFAPDPKIANRFERFKVHGARSGLRQDVVVFLPKGYDPKKAGGYPVILALHGYPGSPASFKALGRFYSGLDEAVESHRLAPSIVVIPAINPKVTFDSECVDSPRGPKVGTWVTQDVPAFVRGHFNAASDRQSWAAWGYSFGGYCAISTVMRAPTSFAAAVAFQPYYRPEFSAAYRPFRTGSAELDSYDLVLLARTSAPSVAIWAFANEADPFSYPQTNEFAKAVRKPTSLTAVYGKGGGHRLDVWARKIPVSFDWLGANVSGFKPPAPSS